MSGVRRLHGPFAALLLTLSAGCAPTPAAVPYGGELVVMAPSPDFAAEVAHHRLPPDWVTLGRLGSGELETVELDGLPALRVSSGAAPFVVARRVDARLSVTPYLSWAWYVEPPAEGPHPVHLVVGLRDAATEDDGGWPSLGEELPAHDRVLALTWGASALSRGALEPAGPGGRPPSRYVVRGGAENGSRWYAETVDLSELYHRLWPGRRQDAVRVVFVGLAAGAATLPRPMHIAAITLSR